MIDGEQYYIYFLHQATAHPELLHSETNLSFAQVSVEEAFGDLRSADVSESGYIMRLIQPSYRLSPGPDGNPGQTFDGGFLIARTYDRRNRGSEDYRSALFGSERIAIDIVRKMYADSQAQHPMFQGRAHSSMTVTMRERPVTGDAGYGGWLVLWSLPNYFNYCTPAESTAWTDGGETPYP